MRRIVALVQDRPLVVSAGALVLVVVHGLLTQCGVVGDSWSGLRQRDAGSVAVSIFLGLAGVGALSAGFAGVVIVFGLDTRSEKFLRFRLSARRSLVGNWTSLIASPITAAALGLAAAAMTAAGWRALAPWLFELGCLMFVHGALRMIWLLRVLMGVVAAEDAVAESALRLVPLESVIPRKLPPSSS